MKRAYGFVETVLPEGADAAAVFLALARHELADEYFLYASDSEARIAFGCAARVTVDGDKVTLEAEDGRVVVEPVRDPFEQVPRLLKGAVSAPQWTAYGHVSFDIARHYLPYGRKPEVPELVFTIPEAEIVLRGQRATVRDGARVGMIKEILDSVGPATVSDLGETTAPAIDHSLSPKYENKVRELTRAIREGDLSKAILSRRVVFDGHLDVPATYATASRVNGAVRSFGFRTNKVASVGFSPEVLLEATAGGTVTTCLLAGTRKRGETPEEDERLQAELLASAKEVKEHAISVQLAQEEIRSVCRPDSVRIFEFMNIKKFRSVQHLGSKVSGRLKDGLSPWDALRVLFPAITVAGVPKDAALKWIGSLEENPRGVYGGVVGFVDSTGHVDLTLAIRSAFEYEGQVHLQAGAGIVAESDPEFEYFESVNKMKMMLGQTVLANVAGAGKRGRG